MDNSFFNTSIFKLIPYFNPEIVKQFADSLDMTFVNQREPTGNVCLANSHEVRPEFKETFSSKDLLNYIYAIFYSSTYRKKNIDFLKINYTSFPVPKDKVKFWKFVNLGDELRKIHSFESNIDEHNKIQYPEDGNNIVSEIKFVTTQKSVLFSNFPHLERNCSNENLGRVYINKNQYFDWVPAVVWNFYFGGCQPAQKWLQDLKEYKLTIEDISYYQKMIIVLSETIKVVKDIDKINI